MTSTTSSGYETWRYWSTSTTATSSATDYTWGHWVEATESSTTGGTGETATIYYNTGTWTAWSTQDDRTREQRRAENAQNRINEYVEKEQEKDAELTAQELLKDLITEEEMETYLKTGRLLVKGKSHDYVLEKGYQARVLKIAKGKIVSLAERKKVKVRSLCVHPVNQSSLPDTDKIISMKLAIEAEEKRVLDLANDHGERELDLASNG
jgi:hypothetical protein